MNLHPDAEIAEDPQRSLRHPPIPLGIVGRKKRQPADRKAHALASLRSAKRAFGAKVLGK